MKFDGLGAWDLVYVGSLVCPSEETALEDGYQIPDVTGQRGRRVLVLCVKRERIGERHTR